MASLAATDFLGRGLHARGPIRIQRGKREREEKEKGTPGYEKLYVTFK